jgi:hypothetical protein
VTTFPGSRRRQLIIAFMATLVVATGCTENQRGERRERLQTVELAEMKARVRDFAMQAVTDVHESLPADGDVLPVPCSQSGGDLADDGSYHVMGSWTVPLPPAQQRATFQRLRTDWQARGYEITAYKEVPDSIEGVISARDPKTNFTISFTTTDPPEFVAMLVNSSCAMSPDHKYPG